MDHETPQGAHQDQASRSGLALKELKDTLDTRRSSKFEIRLQLLGMRAHRNQRALDRWTLAYAKIRVGQHVNRLAKAQTLRYEHWIYHEALLSHEELDRWLDLAVHSLQVRVDSLILHLGNPIILARRRVERAEDPQLEAPIDRFQHMHSPGTEWDMGPLIGQGLTIYPSWRYLAFDKLNVPLSNYAVTGEICVDLELHAVRFDLVRFNKRSVKALVASPAQEQARYEVGLWTMANEAQMTRWAPIINGAAAFRLEIPPEFAKCYLRDRSTSSVIDVAGSEFSRLDQNQPTRFNANRVRELIQQGESQTVEFKQSAIGMRPENLTKSLLGFANTNDGYILFGVNDDATIAGLESPEVVKQTRKLVLDAATRCRPAIRVAVSTVKLDNRTVLAVRVPHIRRLHSGPNDNVVIYIRVHATTRSASSSEIEELVAVL
jgi:hypothetical protein